MVAIERQVIVTWYTPEERLPEEDVYVVVTMSGHGPYVTYDHALMLATWCEDEGWMIDGLNIDTDEKSIVVHAWADLEPYGAI